MRYKIIDQRQQRIDKEVEKERRNFINGAYLITLIQILVMLITAFYFTIIQKKVDEIFKYAVIYNIIYLPLFFFTKEKYSRKLFTILINTYYIVGMIIDDIIFGIILGNIFQLIIDTGEGKQIIPAILMVIAFFMISIFSNIFRNIRKYRSFLSWCMIIVFIFQFYFVTGKLLTIVVDIIAIILSLLELHADINGILNEYNFWTSNGKKYGVNLLPYMIQNSIVVFCDMFIAMLELLKLDVDSNNN